MFFFVDKRYISFRNTALTLIASLFFFSFSVKAQKENPTKIKESIKPDYSIVFPDNKVNRIDIVINHSDWDTLTATLTKKFGKQGDGNFMSGPPPGMEGDSAGFGPGMGEGMMPPPGMNGDTGAFRPDMGGGMMPPPGMDGNSSRDSFKRPEMAGGRQPFPGRMGGPGMPPGRGPGFGGPMGDDSYSDLDKKTVPCTIKFNGLIWNFCGFRFKGNSSLMMSWRQGNHKMPFRLDFSEFADSSVSKDAKRFYGFKEMSFTNNINDNTCIREKLAGDIFRAAGIKAARSSFYAVYINLGDGPVYYGVYSVIEIIEDNMLKEQFGSKSGNCYKPDIPGGSFAKGIFNEKSFVKKTNKKASDFKDVKNLYEVLNSDLRTANPKEWCSKLEGIFDVPVFLKWLAVNTVIQNWDTYGSMAHNYYLYNNPETKKLVWIPWDNNEAFRSDRMRGMSMSHHKVDANWPLIRYILDQPQYYSFYKEDVKIFLDQVFKSDAVKSKISDYSKLVRSYVKSEKEKYTFLNNPNDFDKAITELQQYIDVRIKAANDFLKE